MAKLTSRTTATLLAVIGSIALGWGGVLAQSQLQLSAVSLSEFSDPDEAKEALDRAKATAEFAQQRAAQFSADADAATAEAERLAKESAALAAQIQQSEANRLAASARLALIADQRRLLDARLAQKQQPLVRLTAALQNMARRPVVLSALQPGSLRETVYVRAVLETTLPTIRAQTAGLRSEVEQGRALEREAAQSLAALKDSESLLQDRRAQLSALMVQQQESSRSNSAMARREAKRALELAEGARDLDELVSEFDRASSLRADLASLAGPIIRPERPGRSRVMPASKRPTPRETGAPASLQLPVQGRTLIGFGEESEAKLRSKGLTIAPSSGAQIVAPATGRVAYAGEYRGFGRIVIVEHANGWTSVVTGLAQTSVATGANVIAGAPIGTAGLDAPRVTFELREGGKPVNPLIFLDN